MNLRSPLSQARGLGSAKEGVGHWWLQRMTALALVPLTLWFVFSMARYPVGDYVTFLSWIKAPLVAATLVLYLAIGFYHSSLGVRVVVEDYIGNEAMKMTLIVLSNFGHLVLGVGSVFSVLKLAFT